MFQNMTFRNSRIANIAGSKGLTAHGGVKIVSYMIVFLNITAVAWMVGVVVGYLLGRVDVLARAQSPAEGDTLILESRRRPATVPSAKARAAALDISIDEKKFVAPINTDGMTRNEKIELGKTTEIADDINSSVSKLAQLKGK